MDGTCLQNPWPALSMRLHHQASNGHQVFSWLLQEIVQTRGASHLAQHFGLICLAVGLHVRSRLVPLPFSTFSASSGSRRWSRCSSRVPSRTRSNQRSSKDSMLSSIATTPSVGGSSSFHGPIPYSWPSLLSFVLDYCVELLFCLLLLQSQQPFHSS